MVNGIGSSDGIFNSIKDSLFNSQTLGGLVSVGASLGLDAIGAPPILQSFVPGLLGQLVAGDSGQTGGGGGPGEPDGVTSGGQSLFGRIVDNLTKFGKGIVSAAENVVSFGAKVLEGVGSITKAGFGKAVDFFSSALSRQTIEKLISIGGGSIKSAIEQFSNITSNGVEFIKDGLSIIWNATTDTFSYVDGALRGTFDKLIVDPTVGLFKGGVALAQTITDGIVLDQSIEVDGSQSLAVKDSDGNVFLKMLSNGAKAIFDGTGNFVNGVVEVVGGFTIGVVNGAVDFFKAAGREGFLKTLVDGAKDILALGADAILTVAQKTTLTVLRVVNAALSPLVEKLDSMYGKLIGRADDDPLLKTPAELADRMGMPKEVFTMTPEEIAALPNGELRDTQGNLLGRVFLGGEEGSVEAYRQYLPQEVQSRLDSEPGLASYFNNQPRIFIGNTTGAASFYQEMFSDEALQARGLNGFQIFFRKWLLSDGLHNEIKRDWFADGLQDLITSQRADGLAQMRLDTMHLTDIFTDSNEGFFFLHGPESPNILATGLLEHILVEVPEHQFTELAEKLDEFQITACETADGICLDS